MKRFMKFIILFAFVASMLAGCAKAPEADNTTAEDSNNQVAETEVQDKDAGTDSESAWPRTYVDGLGKEVIIEKEPQRIVVLHFGYTEYLLALDVVPVGVASLSIAQQFETLNQYEELNTIIDVGETVSPNLEKILELQPDLIIAGAGIHDDMRESLKKIAPVVFKKNYGKWDETLQDYAQMLGREEKAEQYIESSKEIISQTYRELEKYSDKTFVFLRPSSKSEFGIVGSEIYSHYHDSQNGFGMNVPENYPESWAEISLEALVEMNPDYIFFQDKEELCRQKVAEMESSSVWNSITAVKEGNIGYLDISLNTGSPLAIRLASEQILEYLK
ncbi:ABC transporter substrate-binding protein [Sedimentibacter sp.]|uniref:ABC transporter substrate-binding protein n=1 Tax=Sedimentibacter sp. TaxID=1960295 RepID=UPI0028AFA722|nr:ABC transporter substrate-binding protein [Sedimentibacter sp.]